MDRLISDLTVAEFIGVQAICFGLFWTAMMLVRMYEHTWPLNARIMYWGGVTAVIGLPLFLGARATGVM